jgi:hypothetical protein
LIILYSLYVDICKDYEIFVQSDQIVTRFTLYFHDYSDTGVKDYISYRLPIAIIDLDHKYLGNDEIIEEPIDGQYEEYLNNKQIDIKSLLIKVDSENLFKEHVSTDEIQYVRDRSSEVYMIKQLAAESIQDAYR